MYGNAVSDLASRHRGGFSVIVSLEGDTGVGEVEREGECGKMWRGREEVFDTSPEVGKQRWLRWHHSEIVQWNGYKRMKETGLRARGFDIN